jgi:hypothetical protein
LAIKKTANFSPKIGKKSQKIVIKTSNPGVNAMITEIFTQFSAKKLAVFLGTRVQPSTLGHFFTFGNLN